MRARSAYEEFHGKPSRGTVPQQFHVPKKLILIGKAVAIEYECDKLNGGGDGRKAIYRHEFETPSLVCMDETAGKQLYIIGKQIVVDERGIRK